MSDDNIIPFRPVGKMDIEPRRKPFASLCRTRCKYVTIDEKTRKLDCKECGQVIEPFDYLWRVATTGENFLKEVDRLDESIRLKHAELEKLNTSIRNAKANVRRAEQKSLF